MTPEEAKPDEANPDQATPLVSVYVQRVKQHELTFYLGALRARDLFDTSYVDRLRLTELPIEKYAGIQRALTQKRVNEIRDYIGTRKAVFPNSIILDLEAQFIESWEEVPNAPGLTKLTFKRLEEAVSIIDGQHRVAALDAAPEDLPIPVAIFVGLGLPQKAEIFNKINSTQKAVNPSISYQLFGYAEYRSPQRTAHEIAKALNEAEKSAFYHKMRMLVGTEEEWVKGGSLTQATFAFELIKLYSKNKIRDEYALMSGKQLEDNPRYPLRKFFIAGNDKEMLLIVRDYYRAIADTWPDQWKDSDNFVLSKSTGYAAWMRVMRLWLLSPLAKEILEHGDAMKARIEKAKTAFEDDGERFSSQYYKSNGAEMNRLRDKLLDLLEIPTGDAGKDEN